MNRKTVFHLVLVIIPFIGVVIVSSYFLLLPKKMGDKTVNVLPEELFGWKIPAAEFQATRSTSRSNAYSNIRDRGGVPRGFPVRLKIPVIGVNSLIEDAVITPDGRMDMTAGSVNVAWFALGPSPGKVGSAVIGGHFGIDDGVPKVFYDLDKLNEGDKIFIEDDQSKTLAFVVRSVKLFDRDADATTVFTSSDGLAHLNLITCEGIWNQVNDTYPQRRVVFTDAVPFESAVAVSQISPVSPMLPETAITSVRDAVYVKSLFETPLSGVITLVLLAFIVWMAFMTFKR